MTELINPSPVVHENETFSLARSRDEAAQEADETVTDPVDPREIYQLLRNIMDPEHPNTLEQLRVVNLDDIIVKDGGSGSQQRSIHVKFTPTVPHCSMTTLIGLCIRTKLARNVAPTFKLEVQVAPGTHNQEVEVNKQLRDKERVAAALESKGLLEMVNRCLNELEPVA